ncbi:hypothetical protein EAF04_010409 [Stromatinia cepivora]|nr:hypothetical protein EAF04_010409 [Stromatinia cepivora]
MRFCEKSHEPIDSPEHKNDQTEFNICGKCGRGWHSGTECRLDPRTPHLLEQFTPRKYSPAKMRQDSHLKFQREEEQRRLNAQFSSSKSLASSSSTPGPPASRPTAFNSSASNLKTLANVGAQLGPSSNNVTQALSNVTLDSR